MLTHYTLLGADGQPTTPVDLTTVQTWINAGRVFREQKVLRSDLKEWFKAGDFVEFTWPTREPAPSATTNPPEAKLESLADPFAPPSETDQADLDAAVGAASWLWTVAALSAVNFLAAALSLGFYFPVGATLALRLGSDAHGGGEPPETVMVGWVLGVLFLGLWVALGYFCRELRLWAFIVALVVLAGDTILCFTQQDWLSLAFHGWVIWRLIGGLVGAYHIRQLMKR